MNKKEIYEQVVCLVSDQLVMDTDLIDPDVKLVDLGFDSLDVIELSLAIEESFDIEISEDDLWSGMVASMTTNDVVEYVLNRRTDYGKR